VFYYVADIRDLQAGRLGNGLKSIQSMLRRFLEKKCFHLFYFLILIPNSQFHTSFKINNLYKSLSSEYINKHPYFTARKDSYQTPTGKLVDPYFVVEIPTSVVAMAITEENEVILVKQYRYPVNALLTELPGGFINPSEQPMQAIQRELLEETGYSFASVHYLGVTAANPGVLNNFTHMFLALGGRKTADQQLDNNEEIEIVLQPLENVRLMLQHREIPQSMHALCLFYGFNFLEVYAPGQDNQSPLV